MRRCPLGLDHITTGLRQAKAYDLYVDGVMAAHSLHQVLRRARASRKPISPLSATVYACINP